MYGMLEYLKYAGYDATQIYTQLIYSTTVPLGFPFAEYMAEIDAGRVVMIQVEGHSMFGYGYDAANNLIYLHDTWAAGQHSMTWGGSYSGLYQWGVEVMELAPTGGGGVPEPATVFLLGAGLVGVGGFRRWLKR